MSTQSGGCGKDSLVQGVSPGRVRRGLMKGGSVSDSLAMGIQSLSG